MKKFMKHFSFMACAAFMMISTATIISSCSKDEEWKGCTCSYTYNGERETETVSATELIEEGINNCAQAKLYLAEYDVATNISCSDL
jgi:hypothetical protein